MRSCRRLPLLERYTEAINVSPENLRGIESARLTCLPAFPMWQMAGDYDRFREFAREFAGALHVAAGAIEG
jgi:hypothetical protein